MSARSILLALVFASFAGLGFATSAAHAATAAAAAEDWKGTPEATQGSFGAITGVGVFDGSAGYSLLGTASKKIVDKGFASDINNSVSIEAEAGPLFVLSSTAFQYSLHLRWDFTKDDQWTLYGLGGLGGDITGSSLGSKFELYPRFGIGALWRVIDQMALRLEVSHELIAVGVLFPF